MGISIDLIHRCKANDKNAFNELLQQYEKCLYRICYFYCQDKDEALDIMQEVFIKVFRHIDTFDESRPILPWLKRIAVNTCMNYQRNHKKIVPLSLDRDEHSLLDGIPMEENAETDAISNYYEEIIATAIASLAENYRIALTLRYVEDLSYQQIADMLELPLGTVKSNIFRGRSLLREILRKNRLLEE